MIKPDYSNKLANLKLENKQTRTSVTNGIIRILRWTEEGWQLDIYYPEGHPLHREDKRHEISEMKEGEECQA